MVVLGGGQVSVERGIPVLDTSREALMLQSLTRQGCLVGIWALRALKQGRLVNLPLQVPLQGLLEI